jgi:uncharacterized lipoprotein YddW (UPF0748 family)
MQAKVRMGSQARMPSRNERQRSSLPNRLVVCGVALLSGMTTAVAQVLPPPPAEQPMARPRVELRGVWLTANDMPVLRDRDRMRQTMAQLARLNFNTVYPVVWNSGIAYYPSKVARERQIQDFSFLGLQGQDSLGELIAEGRRQGCW